MGFFSYSSELNQMELIAHKNFDDLIGEKIKIKQNSFYVAAVTAYNKLPLYIKDLKTPSGFKRNLKLLLSNERLIIIISLLLVYVHVYVCAYIVHTYTICMCIYY